MSEDSQNQSEEGMQELMAKLPPHIRDFIYSPEMEAIIATIGKKNNLHIDQIGALEAEAAAAMAGLTKTEDLEDNIATALELDTQKSVAVTKDISEMLFMKIREGMKASSTKPEAAQTPSIPPAAQTPPFAPIQTHEVIMPSSAKPVALSTPTPTTTPVAAPMPPSTLAPAPKPAAVPNLGVADAILSEKKVTPPAATPTPTAPATLTTPAASPMPKVDPAQPQNYKADPYREPVE